MTPYKCSRRLSLLPVACAVLALSLSACGSGNSNGTKAQTSAPTNQSANQGSSASAAATSQITASSAPGSASAPQSPPADLVAKANQEGKVVVYTTIAANNLKGMIDAFNKDYPKITVQPLRLTGQQLLSRVEAEQKGGKYAADIVQGDAPHVAPLVNAGALAPYDPPTQANLPAGLVLPKGYTGVAYLLTAAIGYNPTAVKAAGLTPPTSWQDLTKPEWKGKFSVDPTATDWYEMLIASMGHDKALQLVKALGSNSPVLVESHTQALTQVQSGEQLAAAVAYGYKAAALKKKTPNQMAFVNPTPLPVALNLIDVAKKAPHPAAAKVFEDWFVSRAGQKAVVDVTNETSLRSDVGDDATVYDPQKWPPVFAKSFISNTLYNTYATELKQALHAQ